MIHVIASIRVKTGKAENFLEAFNSFAVSVRKERGCIRYIAALEIDGVFSQQQADKDVVTIIEAWEDIEALRDHIANPGMAAYREKTKDIVEDRSAKVLQEA
jgi:quinol monooxygenase YgiN